MTKLLSISLLLALSTIFFACKSDPKSSSTPTGETVNIKTIEDIQVQYYARYIADEKELKAEASFFSKSKEDEKMSITFSSVLLNDNPMRLDQSDSKRSYYKLNQKGEAPSRMAFQMISEQGKKEEDVIVIPELKDFSFGKKLSPSKDGFLTWKGNPLGDKESLVFLFTNEKDRTTSTILNGPTVKSELIIPASKIKNLEPGNHRVYIVRKNRFIETKKGRDGTPREIKALTEYYSKTIEVEVSN
ncbi:MAG: hypothetical protein AB8F74_00350 [Saprospiraceae bacterium]